MRFDEKMEKYNDFLEKTMDYLLNTSIESPDGEYNLTRMTIWLQKIPHIDIKLNKINSTFNPEDNDYLESLGILVAIPGFWLILTLLFFLIFFLCRCCDVNSSTSTSGSSSTTVTASGATVTSSASPSSKKKSSDGDVASSCQLSCCKCILFLFTLITIMIISINFYGTYQSQQGLAKVQKSLILIHENYLKPFDNLTNEIDINLDQKIDLKLKLLSQKLIGPLVRNYTVLNRLTDLVERLRRNVTKSISKMSEIKTQLQIIQINQLPDYLQLFEYYRLPITLAILCSLLFICLLLLCGICRHSRCLLIIFSVLGLLCLVICWVFTSLYLGITVSGTDFCLKPKPFLRKQFSSTNTGDTVVIDYYLNCDQYEYDDGYSFDDYYESNYDNQPKNSRDGKDGRQKNRDDYNYGDDNRRGSGRNNNRGGYNNERDRSSQAGSRNRGSIARNDRTNSDRRSNYEVITGTSADNQEEPTGLKHPFQSHYREVAEPLLNLNDGLEKVSRLCENYCHDDELKMFLKELKERINYVMASLNKIRRLYDCQDVHNEYVNIMDYTCKDVLEGVTLMLISSSIIGILLTLLVLCASHTWINIRKKRVVSNDQSEETDPFLPPASATSTVSSANSKRLRDNYAPSSINRPSAPAHRFSHTPPQTPHFPATGPMNQSLPTPPSINGRSIVNNCREEQFSFLNAPPSYEQVGHHHVHHGPPGMMQPPPGQVQQQAVGPHYVVSYRKL